jgi:hypothetical protein
VRALPVGALTSKAMAGMMTFLVVADELLPGDGTVAVGVYLVEDGLGVGRTVVVGTSLLRATGRRTALRGLPSPTAVALASGPRSSYSLRCMLWRAAPAASALLLVHRGRAIGVGLAELPRPGRRTMAAGPLLAGETRGLGAPGALMRRRTMALGSPPLAVAGPRALWWRATVRAILKTGQVFGGLVRGSM